MGETYRMGIQDIKAKANKLKNDKQYWEAIDAYKELLNIIDDKTDLALTEYDISVCYSYLKEDTAALTHINRAINYVDNLDLLYLRRGSIFFFKKDYPSAISDFEVAIDLNPDEGYSYAMLAISYHKKYFCDDNGTTDFYHGDNDDIDVALNHYEKAETLGGLDTWTYYEYASLLHFCGLDNKAIEKCRKSLALASDFEDECKELLKEIGQEDDCEEDGKSYEEYYELQDKDTFNCVEKSLSELMEELNGLIGLDSVKNEVNSLINLLRVNKVRAERGMKQVPTSKHLVFSGNPGTGKTTVARILAKIYKSLGVLSKGQLVEVDRSRLVAGYVGQTAIQTQEIIQQAMGGILFIDEAYTLSSSKGSNDFGQEAIDTILKAMEDNRDDFVVIVAGYPDLMQDFLDSNPGLRSRFNKFIYFDDYTPDELTAIFNVLCEKSGYAIDDEIDKYLHDYFEERYNNRDRNFANGREVRNFFEIAVSNQANRLATDPDLTDEELITLTIEDVMG